MELIFHAGSSLLEGPIWDATNKLIYCVSIEQGIIYQIKPNLGEIQSFPTQGSVGCVALTEMGHLLSAEKEGIFLINPKTKENDGRFGADLILGLLAYRRRLAAQ